MTKIAYICFMYNILSILLDVQIEQYHNTWQWYKITFKITQIFILTSSTDLLVWLDK